jgi:hypothetical protein
METLNKVAWTVIALCIWCVLAYMLLLGYGVDYQLTIVEDIFHKGFSTLFFVGFTYYLFKIIGFVWEEDKK